MACFHPLTAYRSPAGKDFKFARSVSFDTAFANLPGVEELKLPCGQCLGCRLEKSRQWAIRMMCELQSHKESCFITLTYDEDHLPKNRSLCQEDMTLFLKRLRKWIDSVHPGKKIRYFYCGEYGSKTSRPHYHLILFGYSFSDLDDHGKFLYKEFYKSAKDGSKLWKSEKLNFLWQKGYCPFGSVTFDSCAYVARYILKKLNGPLAADYYGDRSKEFICMSRMPGIGADFLEKYGDQIYSKDFLTIPGRSGLKARPPAYYDRLFELHHPKGHEIIKLTKEKRKYVAESKDIDLVAKERYARHMTKICGKREGDFYDLDCDRREDH